MKELAVLAGVIVTGTFMIPLVGQNGPVQNVGANDPSFQSSAGDIFHLAAGELAAAKQAAEKGDDGELERVVNHYILGGEVVTGANFEKERIKWLALGVQRGVNGARFNLLYFANETTGPACSEVRRHYARLTQIQKLALKGNSRLVSECLTSSNTEA